MTRQEDFVLVPMEPTAEMIAAGASVLCRMVLAFATEEYWAKEVYRAMLSAAPTSPQPQGVGTHKCFECGEELVTLCLACNPLAQAAHPQPSGDGLSEETLREALEPFARVYNENMGEGTGYQPTDDGSGSKSCVQKEVRLINDFGSVFAYLSPSDFRLAAEVFARAVEAGVRSTPTDEWRRAVEACARAAESRIEGWNPGAQACDEAALIAKAIRALSPTKPDAPPHTKDGE